VTQKPRPKVDQTDPWVRAIQEVLEDDLADGARLMEPKYRENALAERTLNGYCATAAAAYFHLRGDLDASLQPMQHTDRWGNSHWWIVKVDGSIVDLVYRHDQDPEYPYYARGKCRGFTNCGYVRVPKRAEKIIARVRAR
jgi:hypothetical protein